MVEINLDDYEITREGLEKLAESDLPIAKGAQAILDAATPKRHVVSP